jgi:hypothetical protein
LRFSDSRGLSRDDDARRRRSRGLNGKIALNSDNNATGCQEQVYLIDPDGSNGCSRTTPRLGGGRPTG